MVAEHVVDSQFDDTESSVCDRRQMHVEGDTLGRLLVDKAW